MNSSSGSYKSRVKRYGQAYVSAAARRSRAKAKARNRDWVNAQKAGQRCVDCGVRPDDPEGLHCDHIDIATKLFAISAGVHGAYALKRVKKEYAKCVLRCPSCHGKRSKAQRLNGDFGRASAARARDRKIDKILVTPPASIRCLEYIDEWLARGKYGPLPVLDRLDMATETVGYTLTGQAARDRWQMYQRPQMELI